MKNYAFIDAQNLHMSVEDLGWKIDYKRFRVYLAEHYNVGKAYLFMGFKPTEQAMYTYLQEAGFIIVFKPILELKDGTVKGNCDAELVLQAMIDYREYGKAVIVTGDGDFHCLIKYLKEKSKLLTVLAPSAKNCSSLIKKMLQGELSLVSDLRKKIEYKRSGKGRKLVGGKVSGGAKFGVAAPKEAGKIMMGGGNRAGGKQKLGGIAKTAVVPAGATRINPGASKSSQAQTENQKKNASFRRNWKRR